MESPDIQQLTDFNSLRGGLTEHLQMFSNFVIVTQQLREAHSNQIDCLQSGSNALYRMIESHTTMIESWHPQNRRYWKVCRIGNSPPGSEHQSNKSACQICEYAVYFIEHRLAGIEQRLGITPPARLTDYLLEDSSDDVAQRAKAALPSLLAAIVEEDESRRRG